MTDAALDVGPARLEARGGLRAASVQRLFAPRSHDEAAQVFRQVADGNAALTLVGARRSFEGHFLPPSSGGLALSSERLKQPVRCSPGANGTLRVRCGAGVTFGELLAAVHEQAGEYMPFSCPTSELISLGGALAANTHGRTTDTYGGFFADHVTAFQLVCPDGTVHECTPDAADELARRLYLLVPGALGALGLVTELELELCAVSPRERVVMQVLSEHAGELVAAAERYAALADDNRHAGGFRFSEGVGLVLFGGPRSGKAAVLARQRYPAAPDGVRLPLFDGNARRNALLQLLVHRFPAPAQWLVPRLLRPGRRYTSDYGRWAFFQTSNDEATRVLDDAGLGVRTLARLLGVDARLTLVHQGWVVPRATFVPFMRCYAELLESERYRAIIPHLELQDVLPLPRSRWPLNPSYRHLEGSHVLTWSCRVLHAEPELLDLVLSFCRELSARGAEHGAVVQLIKQLNVDDGLLREMHGDALRELRELKRVVDPENRLRSQTLERLGLGPIRDGTGSARAGS